MFTTIGAMENIGSHHTFKAKKQRKNKDKAIIIIGGLIVVGATLGLVYANMPSGTGPELSSLKKPVSPLPLVFPSPSSTSGQSPTPASMPLITPPPSGTQAPRKGKIPLPKLTSNQSTAINAIMKKKLSEHMTLETQLENLPITHGFREHDILHLQSNSGLTHSIRTILVEKMFVAANHALGLPDQKTGECDYGYRYEQLCGTDLGYDNMIQLTLALYCKFNSIPGKERKVSKALFLELFDEKERPTLEAFKTGWSESWHKRIDNTQVTTYFDFVHSELTAFKIPEEKVS